MLLFVGSQWKTEDNSWWDDQLTAQHFCGEGTGTSGENDNCTTVRHQHLYNVSTLLTTHHLRSSSLSELTAHTESIQTEIVSVRGVTRKVAEECTIQSISDNIGASLSKMTSLSQQLCQVARVRLPSCQGENVCSQYQVVNNIIPFWMVQISQRRQLLLLTWWRVELVSWIPWIIYSRNWQSVKSVVSKILQNCVACILRIKWVFFRMYAWLYFETICVVTHKNDPVVGLDFWNTN